MKKGGIPKTELSDQELAAIVEEIEEKPEERERTEEYLELLKRVQADFENYKKRAAKEREELVKYAEEDLIFELLEVLDNFERALENFSRTGKKKDFLKGVEMIYTNFKEILKRRGLKPIESIGKHFDPYYHEVITTEESDEKEDTITEEFQKGYMFKEKVIRPSKVKIAKAKPKDL
ncbi:MAG: nucleotide exchange factor GrpE [Candidatus Methanofastidiosia archaeon]